MLVIVICPFIMCAYLENKGFCLLDEVAEHQVVLPMSALLSSSGFDDSYILCMYLKAY